MVTKIQDGAGSYEALLTPAEAAARMRVDAKTIARWAKGGKLRAARTMGGHRRYFAADIEALRRGDGQS